MSQPTVSVIVATFNEEANIDHVLDVALSEATVVEALVADGGSSDATIGRVLARSEIDPRVRLLDNPDQGQSAGLNRAANHATGDLLVRLDAHTRYADDYVATSLASWAPATAVGGPMLAEGDTKWAQAVALAMKNPLAIGPARFRHANKVEEVDTVYLGTFERERFLDLGGYRTFPSGTVEDTDFYSRWRAAGGTVIVNPAIVSWYKPRSTWRDILRQYFRYGVGKAELVWLNGRLPTPRPLAPVVFVAALAVTGVIAIGWRRAGWTWIPLAALGAIWVGALGSVAARAKKLRLRTAIVAGTMHLAYGAGFWTGLVSGRPKVKTLGMVETSDVSD